MIESKNINELQAAALLYAKMGWRVLPVHSIAHGRCTCFNPNCKSPGKHPLIQKWQTLATTDQDQINSWWTQWPWANVGIATGADSGLICVDVDHPGALPQELPKTLTTKTGSGGRHYLYQHPGLPVLNTAGVFDRIDSRGDGGFIVAPPSFHISGKNYEWLNHDDPQPAPSWWLDALKKPKTPAGPITPGIITEGGRNSYLTSVGGALRAKGLTDQAILPTLLTINSSMLSPPLTDSEVALIANSIKNYSIDTSLSTGETVAANLIIGDQKPIQPAADQPDITKSFVPKTGLLAELCNFILESSVYAQPNLALGASLAFLGTVFGPYFRSETGIRTNLYIVGASPSGSGKDHARKMISRLAIDAGLGDFLGGDSIASGRGIIAALEKQSAKLWLLDEFGDLLSAIVDKRSGTHQRDILTTFLKLYSSSDSIFRGTDYADQKLNQRVDLVEPICSIYGTATPNVLASSLGALKASEGSLSRIIVVPGILNPDIKTTGCGYFLNKKLIERLALFSVPNKGKPYDINLCDYAKNQWAKCLKDQVGAPPHLVRRGENIIKISMIAAVAEGSRTITEEIWDWSCSLIDWAAGYAGWLIDRTASDNQTEALSKRLEAVIRDAGSAGLTKSQLIHKSRWLTTRQRDEILFDLSESGICFLENFKTSRKDRQVVKHTRFK